MIDKTPPPLPHWQTKATEALAPAPDAALVAHYEKAAEDYNKTHYHAQLHAAHGMAALLLRYGQERTVVAGNETVDSALSTGLLAVTSGREAYTVALHAYLGEEAKVNKQLRSNISTYRRHRRSWQPTGKVISARERAEEALIANRLVLAAYVVAPDETALQANPYPIAEAAMPGRVQRIQRRRVLQDPSAYVRQHPDLSLFAVPLEVFRSTVPGKNDGLTHTAILTHPQAPQPTLAPGATIESIDRDWQAETARQSRTTDNAKQATRLIQEAISLGEPLRDCYKR